MGKKVFVYDPTTSDKLSSVRGIGRYLQILKENFENEFEFVNNEIMKQLNNDCVFINPFYNFLQRPLTLKRIANKQIAIIHDLIPLKYPSHFPAGIKGSIYILLNKLFLKNYDLIITDSEASKLDIINILGIQENKIKVIYPCLPKVFSMKYKVSSIKSENTKYKIPDTRYCIYVGDATWNKNLVNLAKAIKIADVPIIFVGKVFQTSAVGERSGKTAEVNNGWQSELKEFFELTKDDKRFVFPGFIADNELIKLYQQITFNILPSRDEGFGFSYVESAQFGCPSLLSDISVLRKISDGKAVFFDENNPKDIAEKIKMIYSNKDLRNKIGIDAKKRSEFFNPEKFKREFLAII
ncbi:MAG: glycosyltransferase family 4 protein [Candidatus Roizmanbacteria bacterium]|nr:glycosyltransferase family 4 protein [Candidatus Roizmanbacteria bacterium]MCR4313193.1 glycosyltransferase family 4 protein [Candidatus Roizmanbacteria bacterium]